ncbi:MAG: MMPL family transporter, partial [Myxococcota bacterium]
MGGVWAWLEITVTRRRAALIAAALVALGAAALLPRVQFEANLGALLSPDAPVVRQFAAVKEQLGGGTSDLIVELRGPKSERATFAQELADELVGDPLIIWVDHQLPRDFFAERALLLDDAISVDELRQLVAAVKAAYRDSIGRAMAVLELDDEPDPWQPVRQLTEQLTQRPAGPGLGRRGERSRDGSDGDAQYVFVRVRAATVEVARARQALDGVQAAIDRLDPAGRGVSAYIAGRLAISLAEQQNSAEDFGRSTGLALLLVVLITALVARRLTGPIIIAIPLVLSLVITLAVSTFLVEQLNMISAFMMPALVGLGIDYGIHLYLRFLVELRARPGDRDSAMREAIRATVGASWTSALTTAMAFFAVATVEFRGFRELGVLGGSGVLLTFATTYLVAPPLALVLTRAPRRTVGASDNDDNHDSGDDSDNSDSERGERASGRRPPLSRSLAAAVIAVAVLAGVWGAVTIADLRFENDFRKLKGDSEVIPRTWAIEADLGLMMAPAVIMVPDLATARRVENTALAARIADSAPAP